MSQRSIEALRAGIKALGTNPRRALEVFRMATDDDPMMADAWLGRMAAGDRSAATIAKLADAADRVGQDLPAAGLSVADLNVTFDVEYIRFRIDDPVTAALACIGILLADRKFTDANERIERLPDIPKVCYTRAVLMAMAERWPDVIAAVAGRDGWRGDELLARAGALLEAKAASHLGLFERGQAAIEVALTRGQLLGGPSAHDDPITRDATFQSALIARAQGDEDQAKRLLSDVSVRFPQFAPARTALADSTYGIRVVDQSTIESRKDPWDPSTGRTPEQRQAAEYATEARNQLAEAEERLSTMVGLDEVKRQVTSIKATTAAGILRARKGIPTPSASHHILMYGPPGVGKTEVARIVAKIFCGLGILPRSEVYETSKEALAGQYVGQVETQTRDFLNGALGATVFFDEFGDLLHGGYAHGDPVGQAIIGALVPWMENNRDKAVFIAAGYRGACEKVLDFNTGLRGRFATTIAFESYPPDKLIEIAKVVVARNHSTVEADALQEVLFAPFSRFYDEQHPSEDGDVIRTIDKLNNGRFVRNIIEAAQKTRDLRVMSGFGLDDFDLTDESVGQEISAEALALITRDDLWDGLQQALPPDLRLVRV